MRDISFFSEDKYVHLPSKTNPRVSLAVSDVSTLLNSFKLYNPFSVKARVLKKASQFVLKKAPNLFLGKAHKKSDFVAYLEQVLEIKLKTSVYWATSKDKVVLQLQSNKKVYGYLKFPQNEAGLKNIQNEKKAFKILSEYSIIPPLMCSGTYKNIPYILLSELKGAIGLIDEESVLLLLNKFKKEKKKRLINHSRIKALDKAIREKELLKYRSAFNFAVTNSKIFYYEAFEHGDFAPWNIIKTDKGLIPFDFEFFVENGVEYFDLITYYFQTGRLLKKLKAKELYAYLIKEINISEIKHLVILFLIKEIIRLRSIRQSFDFHDDMIKFICE